MPERTREISFDADTEKLAGDVVKHVEADGDWVLRKSELPPAVAAIIKNVLRSISTGDDVSVAKVPEVVTTTTAAQMLGISRPTLMKRIRQGDVTAYKVGTHTRLQRADVLDFKDRLRTEQAAAITALMQLEDELGEDL